ncbi:hypothetical protein NDU88_004994 [Pleurodeles waltl]|uniref:Uncharacterized protein n=1 Tax=Pleurodeles waltl TaxID=8319 RepID=A0AAV7MX04_PLEWA|nr:hypothetical protein NDU88_004994 [Pleurodeles waltl]
MKLNDVRNFPADKGLLTASATLNAPVPVFYGSSPLTVGVSDIYVTLSLEKAPAYNARGGETRVGCFFLLSSCAIILDVAFAKGYEVTLFERLEAK